MRQHERIVMLSVLDQLWKDHLLGMDHLKEGIGLRGYGQKDPLVEYKRESFDMFEAMMERFEEEAVGILYKWQMVDADEAERLRQQQEAADEQAQFAAAADARGGNGDRTRMRRGQTIDDMEEAFQRKKKRELEQARMAGSGDSQQVQQVVRSGEKIGRNDPCPCGSGKKYKKCCGA
jgi:preprotein translocase subunit SecA